MFDLRLDEDIFYIVKNGTKRVEVRLNDKKRELMKVGNTLTFYKYQMKEIYVDGFNKEEFVELLNRFYTKEEQDKYGFVAIEFEVL